MLNDRIGIKNSLSVISRMSHSTSLRNLTLWLELDTFLITACHHHHPPPPLPSLGNLGNGVQLLSMGGDKIIQLLRLHVVKAFPSHLPCQPDYFMSLLRVVGKASEVIHCLWPQVVPAGVDGGSSHLVQ